MFHGKGKFVWADGSYYEGAYRYNKKEGDGTFVWPDGVKFIGKWLKGRQHGIGHTIKKGKVRRGKWDNGKRVRGLKKSKKEAKTAKTVTAKSVSRVSSQNQRRHVISNIQ